MKLLLESAGNPDYGQDPAQPFPGCEKAAVVEVKSLKEASDRCNQFIEMNELGGGNWTGGQVYEGDKLIAEISYNGRAWTPGPEKSEIIM